MYGRREDRLLDETPARGLLPANDSWIDIVSRPRTNCFNNAHAFYHLVKRLELCSKAFPHIFTRTALRSTNRDLRQ